MRLFVWKTTAYFGGRIHTDRGEYGEYSDSNETRQHGGHQYVHRTSWIFDDHLTYCPELFNYFGKVQWGSLRLCKISA